MNKKKAKQLRRRAKELMAALGVNPKDGENEYEQIKNCVSWEKAVKPDGSLLRDQDGTVLLSPVKNPGTIQCKHKLELFYEFLKKVYKRGDKDAETIINGTEKDLLDMFERN